MKNCACISARTVCSDQPFIVYSHTRGILAARPSFEAARQDWDREVARHAERGKESDALIFEWFQGHWMMCGSLYDIERAAAEHSLSAVSSR